MQVTPLALTHGRRALIFITCMMVAIELMVTAIVDSISPEQRSTYQEIARFGLTVILLFLLWKGSRIAYWISVALWIVAGSIGALGAISTELPLSLIFCIPTVIWLLSAFLLLFHSPTKQYIRHLAGQRVTQPLLSASETRAKEFDFALSFSGKDRAIAEQIARQLKNLGHTVFYDFDHQASLVGRDLFQYFQDIYRDGCKYVVVLVSESYLTGNWTRHELHNIQAKVFTDRGSYLLPVRLDDAALPGLNSTVGYLDLRQMTIDEVVKVLNRKASDV